MQTCGYMSWQVSAKVTKGRDAESVRNAHVAENRVGIAVACAFTVEERPFQGRVEVSKIVAGFSPCERGPRSRPEY